jgi:LPS-assembly protein
MQRGQNAVHYPRFPGPEKIRGAQAAIPGSPTEDRIVNGLSRKPAFLLRCLVAAVATVPAWSDTPAPDQQWQCEAGSGGAWSCTVAPRPEGALASVPSQPAQPAQRTVLGSPADALARSMDWVPRERLTEEQLGAIGKQCEGAYVEPALEPMDSGAVFGTIHASSQESELLQDPEVAKFSGNVTVRQGERRLRADRAAYYREQDRVEIEGEVQYREPGLLVQGESAVINTADESGVLRKARFVMHKEHTRGEADEVLRNVDRSLDLEDGTYTQCEPGHDDWQLAASTIHIDRETGKGTAHSARLEVKGVPVMYTPWLSFPIDDRRMSGFLWPAFTNSSQNGFDVATPYYLNIAPNFDATLVPRYTNDRGPMAGAEVRYLNRWSQWVASGAMLPDDNVYGDDRWLLSLQQQGSPFEDFNTLIDYTEVSDPDYLRNLNVTGLEVKRATHLPQAGALSYRFADTWRVQARAQQYQLLDTELEQPYKMLPRIALSRQFSRGAFKPDFALNSEYTSFEHKDSAKLTGQRVFLEPLASFPMEWDAAFVKPTVGYQSISYSLDEGYNNAGNESPSVAAPLFSLDTGYFLERDTELFGASYLQTLEPRVYYLWVDHDDHEDIPNFDSQDLTFGFSQLFRPTRFSGHDRIADANQASLSMTSRFITDKDGSETLTASIGEIFYFEDRRVTIADQPINADRVSSSEIAAELQAQPIDTLAITGTTLWDPHKERVNEGGVLAHWTPDRETIFNAGYRYRRDQLTIDPNGVAVYETIDQADFSAILPLGDRWKLLARYQYDFTNDYSLEELAGIEYSSCCWALRMVYQEGVDWDQGRDYAVYVQFVLRGLGGIGKNVDQLLQSSIFGYRADKGEDGFAY